MATSPLANPPHFNPKITGIGHGEVFNPCRGFPNDKDQFASDQLVGVFLVYGVGMNSMTIFDSPYGNVEVEWQDPHGGVERASLPVLDRDAVSGSWFLVGVVKDPRYVPANFRFDKITYNDFVTEDEVSGDMSTIKACPYTDGACAPLAPYEAYSIRVRSPFLLAKEWYRPSRGEGDRLTDKGGRRGR